jgi:hypothetical protein
MRGDHTAATQLHATVLEEQERLAHAGLFAKQPVLESRVCALGQYHGCKRVAELLRSALLFRGSILARRSWLQDASSHGGGQGLLLCLAFSARLGFVLVPISKNK